MGKEGAAPAFGGRRSGPHSQMSTAKFEVSTSFLAEQNGSHGSPRSANGVGTGLVRLPRAVLSGSSQHSTVHSVPFAISLGLHVGTKAGCNGTFSPHFAVAEIEARGDWGLG